MSLNNFLPKECYPIEGEITIREGNAINDKVYLIAPCVIEYKDYIINYDDSIITVFGKAELLHDKEAIQSSDGIYSYMINAHIENHDNFNTILISGKKCYLDVNIVDSEMVNGQVSPLIGSSDDDSTSYFTTYMFTTNPDPPIKIVYKK